MPEWGRHTTLELIVEEMQRPVRLDESFERRVMVNVRRVYAEQRRQRRGLAGVATQITHHPAWAGMIAASVLAMVTFGVLRARPTTPAVTAGAAPVQFVLVAPNAHSVAVVGDFNNWGLDDSALVATNRDGVWSVTAPVPVGVHSYAFVVNGKQWVTDPSAPRSAGDDFGMPSSALVVEDGTQ